MLSRKLFENLHSMMAVLVLLEQVLRELYLNFLPLILKSSLNTGMTQFFRTFRFLCTGIKRRNYCCRRGSKLWKIVFIKSIVEKGPHPWIDPDPLSNSWKRDCSTAQTTGNCYCSAAAFSLKSLGTPFMMQ